MYQAQFGPRLTPVVKKLIIINTVIFVLQIFTRLSLNSDMLARAFALDPNLVWEHAFIWQIFTYQFLHGGLWHILLNMLALWMFGSELEMQWGGKKFTEYYLISGTGAGVFIFILPAVISLTTEQSLASSGVTLGASGAIFGILLAYAIYWPDRYLLFMFIFPVKVKYFVLVIGLISLFFTINTDQAGQISHVGHLGGLVTGYLYLMLNPGRGKDGIYVPSRFNIFEKLKLRRKRKQWDRRQQDLNDMQNMEQKLDEVLEKISRYGMKSLTAREKAFLKKASEEMDENRDDQIFH